VKSLHSARSALVGARWLHGAALRISRPQRRHHSAARCATNSAIGREIRAARRTVHVSLQLECIFLFFFAQLPSRLPLLRVRRNAAQAKWNAEASLENHRPLQTSAQCRHRRFEAAPKKFARKVQLFSIFCMRSLDARRGEHVLVHNVRPRHVDTSSVEDALSRC